MKRKDFALSYEEKAEAREAIRLRDGMGSKLSLDEAMRIALRIGPAARTNTTLETGIDAFLSSSLRRGMDAGTLGFYDWHLGQLPTEWMPLKMDRFKRGEIRGYLEKLDKAPDTIKGRLRAIRAMWRWCLRQDPALATIDPTQNLQLELVETRTQERFLEVDEVKKVMAKAGIYTATLALVFFAGVRIEEVRAKRGKKAPMIWGNIDFKGKHIRVPSGKTGFPRIQENLPANVWAWLKRGKALLGNAGYPVDDSSPICPFEVRQAWEVGRQTLGHWPKNCHRHSFITYHVSKYGDTNKTSILIGHQGRVQLLHSRYKGLTTEAKAKDYFSIMPG